MKVSQQKRVLQDTSRQQVIQPSAKLSGIPNASISCVDIVSCIYTADLLHIKS